MNRPSYLDSISIDDRIIAAMVGDRGRVGRLQKNSSSEKIDKEPSLENKVVTAISFDDSPANLLHNFSSIKGD